MSAIPLSENLFNKIGPQLRAGRQPISKNEKVDDLRAYIKALHHEEEMEIQDLRHLIDEIETDVKHELVLNRPKLGNPASVGLAGFALTTMVMQFHNIGWLVNHGPVIWLGVFFGGMAQVIAGLQEFGMGNNFGYSVFTTYGCFWMSYSLMIITHHLELLKVTHEDIGYFLVAFTVYTAIMMVAATRVNTVLTIIFILLTCAFIILDVSHLCRCSAVILPDLRDKSTSLATEEIKEQNSCNKYILCLNQIAGWFMLIAACLALYLMAQLLYKDAFKRDVLPVGPPPGEVLEKWIRAKFVKHGVELTKV